MDQKKIPVKSKKTGQVSMAQSKQGRVASKNSTLVLKAEHDYDKSSLVDKESPEEKSQEESTELSEVKENKKDKARPEPNNLEEYIDYAYSRKGQRVALHSKVEKAICKEPTLTTEGLSKLLELAKEDILLAVPRQLLLAIRNVIGYPRVKSETKKLIEEAIKQNPLFVFHELSGVFNNLPDAITPEQALIKIGATDFSAIQNIFGDNPIKQADYKKLQANLIGFLAVWFVENRGYSLTQINQMLFAALWKLNIPEPCDEADKLRVLTEISDLEGIGLACATFKKEAEEQASLAFSAKRTANSHAERVRNLEADCIRLENELKDREKKLREMQEVLDSEKKSHTYTRAHLGDDIEQIRSRLLRRLKAEANLLNEGLHALRRDPPKIHVMDDHADRVLDGLYKEIKELESEK